jgi:3-phenylpropionate/trans-cinnamate dioxygenase ferredoxin reductase component
MTNRIVIAGAGHAAGQLVASLRQKKFSGEIVLIGEESWLPYQRPPLSKKFLAGEMPAERLYVKPPSFYEDPAVTVTLGTRIERIQRDRHSLELSNGDSQPYDKLVLAVGARVRRLQLPGSDLPGIHYLRTIDDVLAIRQDMQGRQRLVIVGAGYIGLEVAAVASTLGMQVTVVEMQSRVMQRVVSAEVSDFYEQVHREHGVDFMLNTGIDGFAGESRLEELRLAGGTSLAADMVIVGIGILPNTDLATQAGLTVDDGIVVDDRCRTSDPDIYAIGDCTFHPNALLGRNVRLESVHNALEQARTAAGNLCGEALQYADVPWFWSDQYDLKLQIAGLSQGYDQTVLRGNPQQGAFACVYLREGAMIAIDAINSPKDFLQAKPLIARHAVFDPQRLADVSVELKDLAA